MIQHDAYCRTPELSFEERSRVNYDHPTSLDTELQVKHLIALRAGEAIEKPVYDFGITSLEDVTRVVPAPVVVIEGILVLAEAELRNELDLKSSSTTTPTSDWPAGLQRDIEERGRTMESVIARYFATVRPMHVEFVEGSKQHADVSFPRGTTPGRWTPWSS